MMFHRIFFTLFCSLLFVSANGQKLELEWTATYPNIPTGFLGFLDQKLFVDDDKNVIICYGDANAQLSTDLLILKYSGAGDLEWDITHEEPYPSNLNGAVVSGTNVIIGATARNEPIGGAARAILNSYNENGQELYLTTVHEPALYSSSLRDLVEDSLGYLYSFGVVCELPCDYGIDSLLFYVAKIDPLSGEVLWVNSERKGEAASGTVVGDKIRVFGNVLTMPDSVITQCLYEFDTMGNVVDSVFLSPLNGKRFFAQDGDLLMANEQICKINIEGDTVWCYDFLEGNPAFSGEAFTIRFTEEGNILATGWLREGSLDDFNNYTNTVCLDPNGNKIWSTKDDVEEGTTLEGGVTVSASDKYVFVSSQITSGEYPDYYSNFRPILYSLETGAILHDTLIDMGKDDFPNSSAWDGEHFYLYGTNYSGQDPDKPHNVVLFKFGIDEPVATKEQNAISGIAAQPNPFSQSFDLKITTRQSGTAAIKIYNAFGQQLTTKNTFLHSGENSVHFSETDGWAVGIYFIDIEMNGRSYFEKTVKGD
jgi:hypothetical protein